MELFLITGGSKGLGQSLVQSWISLGHRVINFSRSPLEIQSHNLKNVFIDLSCIETSKEIFKTEIQFIDFGLYTSINFVGNAAQIEPIEYFYKLENQKIETALNVNLLTNIYLLNIFLSFTQNQKRKILTLSSGAAHKPIAGWSMYCLTKAALHLLTETIKAEHQNDDKTQVWSYSPGVIDTSMQEVIRNRPDQKFEWVTTFKSYKETQVLQKPEVVANSINELLGLKI